MTAKKESGAMLFSMPNDTMANVFGIEKGNDLILDAGFPAIDVSFFSGYDYIFKSDYKKRKPVLQATRFPRKILILFSF